MVQQLLAAEAPLEAHDEDGLSALQLAAIFDRPQVARCLVAAGAAIEEALQLAQRFGRREVQEVLTAGLEK